MRSLLLCRHGETEWNLEARMQGRGDSPLTTLGLAQADALAKLAASLGVQRIIASPLGRAVRTAQRMAEACGATLETKDALVEVSFGECSGLTREEYKARFPELREARAVARWTHRWPGGESYADAAERLEQWLAAEGVPWADPPVAIVSHQGACRALVKVLTKCDDDVALKHALPSGGAMRVWESGAVEPLATEVAPTTAR